MYQTTLALCALIFLGCSSDSSVINIECGLTQQADGTTVDCDGNVNGNDTPAPADAGAPIVNLLAGCQQNFAVCPQAYKLSWLIEHCTLPYACPVLNSDGGVHELVCLRFMLDDCVDFNTN
jgi:hypothetical protein